jgi:hypothetical protein
MIDNNYYNYHLDTVLTMKLITDYSYIVQMLNVDNNFTYLQSNYSNP